jgi:tellurite resistance protein TerC
VTALWPWLLLNVFLVGMLVLDLTVFHRRAHVVQFREAIGWSAFWIALALAFNAFIFCWRGSAAGLEFLTGWLIEKSLSVDNLFVFLLVFSYFQVPPQHQHRLLFWGILGALVMRLGFIFAGVALLERFHGLIYVFGAVLVWSGIKLWNEKEKKIEPGRNPVVGLVRRVLPVAADDGGGKFFLRRAGRLMATPLLLVLVVIETTDLIFAVDSIPAILSITRDKFIVYSSNAFAILGLRALYFALHGVMAMFHHLHYGLSAILVFVGARMIAAPWIEIPVWVSLAVVAGILALAIGASLRWPKREPAPGEPA